MDMKYVLPALIALVTAVLRYGGTPMAHLTMAMAESASYHQQHMLSLTKLNHTLLRSSGHDRRER